MMAPRWLKVWRDLWVNPVRTTLVVLSIAVGVFSVGLVANSMQTYALDLDIDFLSVNPHAASIYTDTFQQDQIETLRRMDGVEDVEGRSEISLRVNTPSKVWAPIGFVSVPSIAKMRIDRIRPEGQTQIRDLKLREVYIERSGLTLLPVKEGDIIQVKLADEQIKELKVVGIIHDVTSFSTLFTGQIAAFISPETMTLLGGSDGFNKMVLTVTTGKKDEAHVSAVASQVGNKLEKAGFHVYATVVQRPGEHPVSYINRTLISILGVLGGLALFLSGFLVTNTINALISQQTRQIGMMKAVGGTSGQITVLYMSLIFCFGLIAFLVAVPLAALANQALSLFMSTAMNYRPGPFRVPLGALLFQFGVAVIIPLLAGLAPVLKGTGVTVREAINDYGLNAGGFGRSWFDNLLERVSWLPRPLLISIRNTFRKKGRLFLTLSTLTLGGAIFIAVFNLQGSFTQSINQALGYFLSDINVGLQSNYRISSIEQVAMQIPNVVSMEAWSVASARVLSLDEQSSTEVVLWGPPPTSKMIQPIITEGRWITPADENAVVIGNHFLVKRPDVKVGDTIKIQMGERKETFIVVGKFLMPGNVIPPFLYVNGDYLQKISGAMGRASNYRALTTSSQPEIEKQAAAEFKTLLEQQGVRVSDISTGSDQRAQQAQSINILVYFMGVMALLIALVGGIGLMGTMSMNVMERTREIGVMRSIGATNGSLYGIVLVEGIMIGLISWGLALLFSVPFSLLLCYIVGVAFIQTPMALVYSPIGVFVWLGVVMFLSALASLIPASHAVRLTVRDVLSYE
jgi:putative ABC transport system permease protein